MTSADVLTTQSDRASVESPAEELRRFLADALPAFRAKWSEHHSFAARLDWQRQLHADGWVAPGWPRDLGGRGLEIADRIACDLVLGELRAPGIAGILGVNNVGPTLAAWGSDEQRMSLRCILSGDEIWCQGFSEPEAGSDLAGLRMQARIDGDHFVVNGQKVWTSQGMEATHCQLLVRTDPDASKHKGISALAVPLDLPGITRRPLRQINGESDFAELFFDDVRIPISCLLGPLNQGWYVTMTTLSHERAGVLAVAGMLEADVASMIEAHRLEVGQTQRLSPVLRDELVRCFVDSRVLGMMGAQSLAEAAAGGAPGAEQSLIKLAWSLLGQRVADLKLNLSGLAALSGEDPEVENAYLSSKALTIAGGTTEVVKNILAERVLGLPKG